MPQINGERLGKEKCVKCNEVIQNWMVPYPFEEGIDNPGVDKWMHYDCATDEGREDGMWNVIVACYDCTVVLNIDDTVSCLNCYNGWAVSCRKCWDEMDGGVDDYGEISCAPCREN